MSQRQEVLNTKIEYLSLMRVISCFAVVNLHSSDCFWKFSRTFTWKSALLIHSIFYFAVPVFFMISGTSLLTYRTRYTTREFCERRIKKTLVPYIFWNFFSFLFSAYLWRSYKHESTLTIINNLLNNTYNRTYWFFTALFEAYLSIPLYAAVMPEIRDSLFLYLFLVGFTINICIPFSLYIINSSFHWPYHFHIMHNYQLYLILGFLLHNRVHSSLLQILIYMLGASGLIISIIGTYKLSLQTGKLVRTLRDYNSLPCMLYSTSIYCLIKDISPFILKGDMKRLIQFLEKYTFGIYLLHCYCITVMRSIFERLLRIPSSSLLYRLLLPIIIILILIPFIATLKRIPLVCELVP